MTVEPKQWECPECGYAFYDSDGWDQWFCHKCGSEMETVPPEGHVPISELEGLVDRWEERYDDEITMLEKAAYGTTLRELQELIEDYRRRE